MGHLWFTSVPPTADTNRGYSGKECFSQSRESGVTGVPAQSPIHSRCSVTAGLTGWTRSDLWFSDSGNKNVGVWARDCLEFKFLVIQGFNQKHYVFQPCWNLYNTTSHLPLSWQSEWNDRNATTKPPGQISQSIEHSGCIYSMKVVDPVPQEPRERRECVWDQELGVGGSQGSIEGDPCTYGRSPPVSCDQSSSLTYNGDTNTCLLELSWGLDKIKCWCREWWY